MKVVRSLLPTMPWPRSTSTATTTPSASWGRTPTTTVVSWANTVRKETPTWPVWPMKEDSVTRNWFMCVDTEVILSLKAKTLKYTLCSSLCLLMFSVLVVLMCTHYFHDMWPLLLALMCTVHFYSLGLQWELIVQESVPLPCAAQEPRAVGKRAAGDQQLQKTTYRPGLTYWLLWNQIVHHLTILFRILMKKHLHYKLVLVHKVSVHIGYSIRLNDILNHLNPFSFHSKHQR